MAAHKNQRHLLNEEELTKFIELLAETKKRMKIKEKQIANAFFSMHATAFSAVKRRKYVSKYMLKMLETLKENASLKDQIAALKSLIK